VELHLDRDPLALAIDGNDVDALIGLQAEPDAVGPVIPEPDIGETDGGVAAEEVGDDALECRAHALLATEGGDSRFDRVERRAPRSAADQ
jgi:hypothetical protein